MQGNQSTNSIATNLLQKYFQNKNFENLNLKDFTALFKTNPKTENSKLQTKIIHNDPNPIWNQTLEFNPKNTNISSNDCKNLTFNQKLNHDSSILLISMYDNDRFNEDDLIGHVFISTGKFYQRKVEKLWFPVNLSAETSAMLGTEIQPIYRSDTCLSQILSFLNARAKYLKKNVLRDDYLSKIAYNFGGSGILNLSRDDQILLDFFEYMFDSKI